MKRNWKRGLFRLWLAATTGWVTFTIVWGILYWPEYVHGLNLSQQVVQGVYDERAKDHIFKMVLGAMIYPVPALIVGAFVIWIVLPLGKWIYRGFQREV